MILSNRRILRRLCGCSRAALAAGCTALALGLVAPAQAQDQTPKENPKPQANPATEAPPQSPRDIVVYGSRVLAASLKGFTAEQVYDEDRVASYGASSVGELLDAVSNENGDIDPLILVNGRPVADRSEIADLPVEAVARVEQMPTGSSSRVGAAPGQRTYNVVLKPAVMTMVTTGSYQFATEGGWDNTRADVTFTHIQGHDRLNLSLRGGWSGHLLENERPITASTPSVAYSPVGNVLGTTGSEIDPLLSALAGQTVFVAAVPIGRVSPTLADFAAGAGQANASGLSSFRSLRGRSQPLEASLSGNKVLAPWLSVGFNGRLTWGSDLRFNGLPAARFVLPVGHPNSPFSRNVSLAFNDPNRPLTSRGKSTGVNFQVSFNATSGDWRATLSTRYDDRSRISSYDLTGSIPGGTILLGPTDNPFASSPAGLIPITTTLTSSTTTTREVRLDAEGPLANLPTGQMRVRFGMGGTWLSLDGGSSNGTGERHFRRFEYEWRGGLTIPLGGGGPAGSKGIGPSELSMDASLVDLGSYGTLESLAVALTWQLAPWLRLTASQRSEDAAVYPELVAAPIITIPNVRYFDPVNNETVDVTLITGGGGNLAGEHRRVRRVALNAAPWKAYNLQLNADFLITDVSNHSGPLPLPSPAVVAAFPERFVRDGSGRLVLVDSRTVNFDGQHTSELRTSAAFSIPLARIPVRGSSGTAVRQSKARPVLQVNLAYTHVFSAKSTIREALGPVDLLAGGAIGLFGGRPRNSIDVSMTLSDRGTGLRLGHIWRGSSFLASGTALAPDLLSFDAISRIDLKLFADAGRLFGPSPLTKGLRITLSVDNLGNSRQLVRNQAGITPLGYQPFYRDPLGRTVSIELRKAF